MIVLRSSRRSRKTPIVFRKIFRFQIFIRSFVARYPLATQFLHQAILMYTVVALHPPFGVSRGLRRNVPVKHDDFALLILIIRGADMNLN